MNELVGMRKILDSQVEKRIVHLTFLYIFGFQAKIPEDEILGVRAPGLTPGFNAQYEVAYHSFHFTFHSLSPFLVSHVYHNSSFLNTTFRC